MIYNLTRSMTRVESLFYFQNKGQGHLESQILPRLLLLVRHSLYQLGPRILFTQVSSTSPPT